MTRITRLALMLAALAGCVEQRTAGVDCFSGLDCPKGQRCETDRGVCAPDVDPTLCPMWTDPTGWPRIVVLGPKDIGGEPMDPLILLVRRALGEMGDRAPNLAVCRSGSSIVTALNDWPEGSRLVLIGPYTFDGVSELYQGVEGIEHLDALILSLRRERDGRWAMSPGGVDLAALAAEGITALGITGPIAVVQRPESGLETALSRNGLDVAYALPPPPPGGGSSNDDGEPRSGLVWPSTEQAAALDAATLVIFETLDVEGARAIVRAVLGLPSPPPLLMLESYPDVVSYQGGTAPRVEALCGLRALTTMGIGAVDLLGDDNAHPEEPMTRAAADEARLYDAILLAGLLLDGLGGGDSCTACTLDSQLTALLRSEPDSPTFVLDRSGWSEAADRLRAGQSVRLVGASAVSIPDPDARHPRPDQVWLRRMEARVQADAGARGRIVLHAHNTRVVTDGGVDRDAFVHGWSAGDCPDQD